MNMITVTPAEAFAKMITSWDVDQLLRNFSGAVQCNSFGSHDEQIAIVTAEIKSRMA